MNASRAQGQAGTAIIGISSIHLLKTFINADNSTRHCSWQTVIHVGLPLGPGHRLVDKTAQPSTPRSTEHHMTATIRYADLIQSVAAAFQYISYYHPPTTSPTWPAPMSASKAPPPRTPSRRS